MCSDRNGKMLDLLLEKRDYWVVKQEMREEEDSKGHKEERLLCADSCDGV